MNLLFYRIVLLMLYVTHQRTTLFHIRISESDDLVTHALARLEYVINTLYFKHKILDLNVAKHYTAECTITSIIGTVGRTLVFDRRTFPVLRSTCS